MARIASVAASEPGVDADAMVCNAQVRCALLQQQVGEHREGAETSDSQAGMG